jgi:DNA processing protein
VSVCAKCARRGELLAGLAGEIEGLRLDRWRLVGLLGQDEARLVELAGGRAPSAVGEGGGRGGGRTVGGVCDHDVRYPARLREVLAPPAALYVASEGEVERLFELLCDPVVAVVGSRRSTYYGRDFAFGLARELTSVGVTVLSGLGQGIEASAVQGALAGGGRPLVAMAGGAAVGLPVQHDRLHQRVLGEGVAVSEMPAQFQVPEGWCFLARSRVIAGLADAVVVVEAGLRSGTMLTAELALQMGREVGVVPGRTSDESAAGSNELLRDGGQVVLGIEDVRGLVAG